MNCPNCAQPLAAGAGFCGNCGAQVVQQSVPPTPVMAPVPPAVAQSVPAAPEIVPAPPVAAQPAAAYPEQYQSQQPAQPVATQQQPYAAQPVPGPGQPGFAGMPGMQASQLGPKTAKHAKWFAIAGIVLGSINALAGILLLAVSSNPEVNTVVEAEGQSVAGIAIVVLLLSLIIFVPSIMALKSKTPTQLKRALTIGCVVGVAIVILSFVGGGSPGVLFFVYMFFAAQALVSLQKGA